MSLQTIGMSCCNSLSDLVYDLSSAKVILVLNNTRYEGLTYRSYGALLLLLSSDASPCLGGGTIFYYY